MVMQVIQYNVNFFVMYFPRSSISTYKSLKVAKPSTSIVFSYYHFLYP